MGTEGQGREHRREPQGQGEGAPPAAHTDDPDLEAEGKADQSKSDLKQAGEKVKDAFKD